ncbi:MAG: FHA domain-containing protein [Verrucomicrobiae bacterium]|nr:FHA domain-containing protein [Verrucomicrobiae bacterium]
MIQLQILSGKMAGTRWTARRFPVRIGRAASNDLRLVEDGVWDEHLELDFDRTEGFSLTALSDALLTLNHERVPVTRLRNGDLIEIGSVRLRFWLGETRQHGLRLREAFVWGLVTVMSLGEIALIYWLLQ